MTVRRARGAARGAAALIALTTVAGLTGCAQVVDAFNDLQGTQEVTPVTPAQDASTDEIVFESQFTRDGSVSLSSDVTDDLEVRLDVWVYDPKRTMEWTPTGEKSFGFAITSTTTASMR